MGPSMAKKPALPPQLLKQLGVKDSASGTSHDGKRQKLLSRKDQRKAQRAQKKAGSRGRKHLERVERGRAAPNGKAKPARRRPGIVEAKSPKKSEKVVSVSDLEADDDELDGSLDEPVESATGAESAFEEEEKEQARPKKAAISKTVKDKLARDDAEIAALERKLGIKGRNLPKSFEVDGLGDLLGDLAPDTLGEENNLGRGKRKAEADEWLARKRLKAGNSAQRDALGSDEEDESDMDLDGLDVDDDDDRGDDHFSDHFGSEDDEEMKTASKESDSDQDSFGGFSSDDGSFGAPKAHVRENPYVAPTSGNVAKYVPPSRRQESSSEAELTARIRRQAQGLINRITESNLVSILGDIEKLYRDYPRQHVSSILVDLLLVQVCDRVSLPDTLLILSAGFATAVYKTIGVDFGAQLIQEVVGRFDQYYEHASTLAPSDIPKETSNIITFVSQLYTFQLIGPNLVFDYIRMLLDDLSEHNAELLLRVIRMCGPTLRQDDPLALKDIVTLIRPAVAKIGEQHLSVRTKFMIETINDLKNNKMKTGVNASALVSEHVIRMKKLLGSLNSRKLKATEPLGIGLKDIRESDKRGKWWLVGASWAGKPSEQESRSKAGETARDQNDEDDEDDEGDDDESILLSSEGDGDGDVPDLLELAREQKINTATQQSIFVAILSSADYQDAYTRLQKLRLNKDRRGDIPTVLMQCVGAEQHYNPYYALVANKLCATDRKVRYSFQDSLWKFFRRIGQPVFEDDADEADEDVDLDMRRVINVAKMFGSLVTRGALGLGLLKCLDMPYLRPKAKAFVEVMLVTVLLETRGRKAPSSSAEDDHDGADGSREAAVARIFAGSTTDAPELARGLQWFIRKVVRKSDLVSGKDAETLRAACKVADAALESALAKAADGL